MTYLSEIIRKPVTDLDGNQIGILVDLITTFTPELAHPRVSAVVVKHKDEQTLVPYREFTIVSIPAVTLSHPLQEIQPYVLGEQDFLLKENVLDKQIIDTDNIRVVRVNDVELVRVNGDMYASNLDVGMGGLLRRVGLSKFSHLLRGVFRKDVRTNSLSWDNVEILFEDQVVRLKVPGDKMGELAPADLADIIGDLNHQQGRRLLNSLDLPQLADTLEEVEPDLQASLLQTMSDEKLADVLEEMAPDEAADLLAELPRERSAKVLAFMETEEGDDVRKLLTYPVDSAGGIMNTEFIAIRLDLTAEQAIQVLRETASEAETIFYVYVTDVEGHLVGVLSLSDLIVAQPQTYIKDFMHTRVVKVEPLDGQDQVARLVSKYNLLAIPVVDAANTMLGIVTSDDALDKIIPTAWKKRLPHYYR
jgi:magnesium transporter